MTQMQLIVRQTTHLPKLAWLAVSEPERGRTEVTCGSGVEAREHFFVEGVWDGDFAAGDFGTTDCFFGSGGIVSGSEMLFVASGSTTDYLYYREDGSRVFVSNSLPLLLARLGDRLDPAVEGYDLINRSIIAGIDGYVRDIPTQKGSVRRQIFRNLRVSASGVEEYDKARSPGFPGYTEYFDYVVTKYGAIAANARDADRQQPLSILTTQSRGYDTTAMNAIAAKFGVDKAFTVTQGKPAGAFADREQAQGLSDDGTEICEVLGIPCVPIDRRSFEKRFVDEHLYYAALDANGDMNLNEISAHVTGVGVLLTGTLGELWYTRESYDAYIRRYDLLDDRLKRVDLGGHGLTEVRLVAGLVHLPFPYIGARSRRDIFAITESPAMDAWRLRNSYDRPIPRRMAEDAGVPRTLFGQTKIASVVEFAPPPVPKGEALRKEYFSFLTRFKLLRQWQLGWFPLVHRANSKLWFAGETRYAWLYYTQRAISKIIRKDFRFALRWAHLNGRLFCFAANRLADQYATQLAAAPTAPVSTASSAAS